MTLQVKPGREYVLGGRVYKAGELVDGIPEKHALILTMPKGPLQVCEDVSEPVIEEPAVEEEDPNELAGGHYRRRDLVVENGRIGETPQSPSSRRGRRRRGRN